MKNNPDWIVTPERYQDLLNKRLVLQFYGIVEYTDVFKHKHFTRWCGYSAPDRADVYACPGAANSAN